MKLLIADDEALTRRFLQKSAEKWGYEVVLAENGQQAWQMLATPNGPRLALLDWMMPELSGLEVCQRLRSSPNLPYVYTVLVTSKTGKEDAVAGLDAGADDFLSKPIVLDELRSRLASGLRLVQAMPVRQRGISVPGFEIGEPLGEGARGTVYRATQLSTGQPVALKLIRVDKISEPVRRRFSREVELTGRLHHPNIVKIYDHNLSGDLYYYAMEIVDGGDLSRFAGPQDEFLAIMRKVCRAVGHAHSLNILHRDLKPTNIMLTADREPKVVDFGMAKSLAMEDQDSLSLTQEGVVVGTPAFMAPEQAAFTGKATPQTDVYALGVLLYRTIVGQHPHLLEPPVDAMLIRIAREPIRPPRELSPNIDPRIEAVLVKALARNAADRYANANELADALDGL